MDIGGAGVFLQAAGAVNSAIGSYYSAKSQQSSLRFAADIADINARISEIGAQSELMKGEREIGALTMRYGQMKSTQRASLAANGVDLGEGSAAEIQASTDILKEIDANTLNSNAVRSAWGYRTQATNYQNDAILKRATASTIDPLGAGLTSLLGSAGSVASSWYNYNKASGQQVR